MCICDIPKEKSEEMIATMEDCFKRFLAKRRCELGREDEVVKFNEVDLLDELIKKCKFSEIELKISQPLIEAAYAKFAHAYATTHEVTFLTICHLVFITGTLLGLHCKCRPHIAFYV